MLNIVIPMAGRGQRFRDAGYTVPKPMIPVSGRPMIEVVVENLRPSSPHRFIFVCLKEHVEEFALEKRLVRSAPGCVVVGIDEVTAGAACTVLAARAVIDRDQPLMIANSDQYCSVDIDDYLARLERQDLAGLIMTMTADDPKWSFVRLDDRKLVSEVAEKQVISNEATVGIYNFALAKDFITAADSMIAREERVNGEFYVAPVYNVLAKAGKRIGIYNIGSEGQGMYGLGIPKDLQLFEEKLGRGDIQLTKHSPAATL